MERKKIGVRELAEDSDGGDGVVEGKCIVASPVPAGDESGRGGACDSGTALQSFLDHIPISSIPNILNPSPVLEIRSDDNLLHAISTMYQSNVSGAPIVDEADSGLRDLDRDIGFIEFSDMVLWSLEELDKVKNGSEVGNHVYFSMLEQNPQIGQTKIAELANQFLWEPFFPVHADGTLFHVMLLFSKHHRLNVVPVIGSSNTRAIGFVTQHAVVQLLLQSAGLAWFDQIADKPVLEFGFKNAGGAVTMYSDQSLADALRILWERRLYAVAVVDRKSGALIGCVRCSDVFLVLEDELLFNKRKLMTVGDFISTPIYRGCAESTNPSTDKELPPASSIRLKNGQLVQMNKPVTNQKSDSLKQVMQNLVSLCCGCSFLVNDDRQVQGMVTLRDVISPFSPPSMDSRIEGGAFFTSVLQQAGCRVQDGVMIKDH